MTRPFSVIDCDQRSPEWVAARLGRLTSSRAHDMLATIKSGEAAARRNYRVQLVLERVTGRSQERAYVSAAMQEGIDREAESIGAYEALTGHVCRATGFLAHSELMAGCSLDGHVGDYEGIIEVKNPTSAVHWEYLRTGAVPQDYYRQVLCSLWITGAQWADWMSYDPSFPEPLRAKIVRITRDEDEIALFDRAARVFLAEVEREVEALQTLANLSGTLKAAAGAA